MTAPVAEAAPRLPLWRLLGGIAILGTLLTLLVIAGFAYMDNFRLDRYMRDLAAGSDSTALSDTALTNAILRKADELSLPVHASDIEVTRPGGRVHIRIAKYTLQTEVVKLDLRLPEAVSR